MIRMRIQVEEMHVYYFIAKKLISNAKLGFMGLLSSSEEKILNSIYNSDDLDEIHDLSKKLLDKLEKEQTELKVNTNPYSFKDIEEIISEAISYTSNLLFKPEVLESVTKTLKAELTTHEKIILCLDKISQAKRSLAGLSPEERKNVLDGNGIEVKKKERKKTASVVKVVDEENVSNVTDVDVTPEIDVSDIPLDEEIIEANDLDVDEGNRLKNVFTAEDVPVEPIENIIVNNTQGLIDKKLEELEEAAEVLDFDEEDLQEKNNSLEQEVENTDGNLEITETEERQIVENVNFEESTNWNEVVESDKTLEIDEVAESFNLEMNVSNEELDLEERVISTVDEISNSSNDVLVVDVVEPSPLEERLVPHDIGFSEPEIVYPDEEVSETIEENSIDNQYTEEVIEEVTKSEVIEDDKTDYAVPEIFKIIERNGVIVDEEIK